MQGHHALTGKPYRAYPWHPKLSKDTQRELRPQPKTRHPRERGEPVMSCSAATAFSIPTFVGMTMDLLVIETLLESKTRSFILCP
jgi:hypothetical protein